MSQETAKVLVRPDQTQVTITGTSITALANVGGYEEVYKSTVAKTAQIKTLLAGTNMVITDNGDYLTFDSGNDTLIMTGSGDTTVTNTSGNTWVIYSPTGTTGDYVTLATFTAYTGDTKTITDGLRTDLNSHTGNTDIHFEMSEITGFTSTNTFSTYTGVTDTLIGTKLPTTDFNTYSGTTAPESFFPISGYTFIGAGGTTVNEVGNDITISSAPATGTTVSWGNIVGTLSDQGDLQTALDGKASTTITDGLRTDVDAVSGQTINNDLDIAYLSGQTDTKLATSDFNTYSGVTDTLIGTKLATNDFNTYSGTTDTLIGTKLATSDFNTYSGVTETAIEGNDLDIAYLSGVTNTKLDSALVESCFQTHKLSIGELNNTFEGTSPTWMNTSIDTDTTPLIILDEDGVDQGITLKIPEDTISMNLIKRQLNLTGFTSNNVYFPSAIMVRGLDSYGKFITDAKNAVLQFSGLTNNKYTFKIFCSVDLSVTGWSSDEADYVSLKLTGSEADDTATLNPIDNNTHIITLSNYPVNGLISLEFTGDLDWTHPVVNAIIITKLIDKVEQTDFDSHTGDTSIHFEMNEITGFTSSDTFNTYTGVTATLIGTKLNTLDFNTYTGTTAGELSTFDSRIEENYYYANDNENDLLTFIHTTAPATYLAITDFNTYSGATATLIGTKLDTSVYTTYTGVTDTLIGTKLATSDFNTYSGVTDTLIGTKLITSDFNTYSGATETAIDTKLDLDATIVSLTGTTSLDATYKGKIVEANGTFTITLPNSMTTGMKLDVINVGTGVITFAASTTLQAKANTLADQWGGTSIYHRGSNQWVLVGDLT